MASSFSLAQLIVARLVLGFGSGGYTATIPVWQSEISGAEHRGAFVNAEGIFLGAGIVIALLLDFGFFFVNNSTVSWRFPFAIQILLQLAVIAFIFTLPESPRWLVMKGRVDDASEVLAALNDVPVDGEFVRKEISTIKRSLVASTTSKTGALRNLLHMGDQRIFNRAMIAVLGQLFQQMCGCSITVAYTITIFEEHLGFGAVKSRGLAIAMQSLLIFGGAGTVLTVDRVGRRPLMLLGSAAMAVCMAVIAGSTSVQNTPSLIAATVFLFLYTPFFALGFLSLTNLYATEVAPLEYRAAIAGVSTATSWLSNFVVVLVTPVGFQNIGYRYWIVYAVINAAIFPTVYFLFPETTGLSLEEMDEVFGQSKSIFDPPKIARAMRKRKDAAVDEIEVEGKY